MSQESKSRSGRHGPNLDPMSKWLAPTVESRLERIPVDAVNDRPWDARLSRDQAFVALRRSISQRGIIEPLLLRPLGNGRFEVVVGSRRLRAARELSLTAVPAVVRELQEAEAALLSAWATLPRLDAQSINRVAEYLMELGLDEDEISLLQNAHRNLKPIEGHSLPHVWASNAPLRFVTVPSPAVQLIDALGNHRRTALTTLTRVAPPAS